MAANAVIFAAVILILSLLADAHPDLGAADVSPVEKKLAVVVSVDSRTLCATMNRGDRGIYRRIAHLHAFYTNLRQ